MIFLGGGPAGYVGAIRAAQLGLTVGVRRARRAGWHLRALGMHPGQALLESAHLATKLRHAAEHGITTGPVAVRLSRPAMKRSRAISTQNSKGVEFLFKKNKITWIKGRGTLLSIRRGLGDAGRRQTGDPRGESRARASRPGSRVRGLPGGGARARTQRTVLSSDDVLVLERAPKSMADRRGRRGRAASSRMSSPPSARRSPSSMIAPVDPAARGRRRLGRADAGVQEAKDRRH